MASTRQFFERDASFRDNRSFISPQFKWNNYFEYGCTIRIHPWLRKRQQWCSGCIADKVLNFQPISAAYRSFRLFIRILRRKCKRCSIGLRFRRTRYCCFRASLAHVPRLTWEQTLAPSTSNLFTPLYGTPPHSPGSTCTSALGHYSRLAESLRCVTNYIPNSKCVSPHISTKNLCMHEFAALCHHVIM